MNPPWTVQRQPVRPACSEKLTIAADGRALRFSEVIEAWRDDAGFRAFFCATLAASPYPALFWEMPPIRRGHADLPFECMVIGSDALARMAPDRDAFAAQFTTAGQLVATFPNLGGDALLLAPAQIPAPACYAHLAAFVRTAPSSQQHALFQALAEAIDGFLKNHDRRVWISTSGLGIAWLHMRLDTVPKYYQHRPYAAM